MFGTWQAWKQHLPWRVTDPARVSNTHIHLLRTPSNCHYYYRYSRVLTTTNTTVLYCTVLYKCSTVVLWYY